MKRDDFRAAMFDELVDAYPKVGVCVDCGKRRRVHGDGHCIVCNGHAYFYGTFPVRIRRLKELHAENHRLKEELRRSRRLVLAAERCARLEETMAQAVEFLQALKRNIDESGPLSKYDGAVVEAVIHMLDETNPRLR
jgi:hypothetical protein